MELTVGDCLKLPSLSTAEVLGGRQGLSHRVYSCTVLEWSDRKMFKPPYFRDGDIVVTSFYYEKSDIAAQCATIRQLQGVGTAALVLFHVGTVIASVDPALIALADELDYPLILIPSHRDVSYSEVIQDVMEAIFFKKSAQNRFADVVLQRFSSLPEAQQNISKLLELISQSTQSHLALYSSELKYISGAAHPSFPAAFVQDFQPESSLDELISTPSFPIPAEVHKQTIYLYLQEVTHRVSPPLFLFFITPNERMELFVLQQAAETLLLANDIWHLGITENRRSRLLHHLLYDTSNFDGDDLRSLQGYIEKPGVLLYLRSDNHASRLSGVQLQRLVSELTGFFDAQRLPILLDTAEGAAVILILEPLPFDYVEEMTGSILETLGEQEFSARLACVPLANLTTIKDTYSHLCSSWESMVQIHPHRTAFDLFHMRIAHECRQIIGEGPQRIKREWMLLELLERGDGKDNEELLDTLATFFLDAGGSIAKTAELMFVHANTVKYRIRKARTALGAECFEAHGRHYLYLALAIRRILNAQGADPADVH